MSDFVIVTIIVIVVIFIIGAAINSSSEDTIEPDRSFEIQLKEDHGFKVAKRIDSADRKSGIALDDEGKKVCLYTKSGVNYRLDIVSYKDLLSSEIFEDGDTPITKTVRGSQLGGMLVGGMLAGGVGMAVGMGTGKTTTTQTLKKLELRLTILRTENPTFTVNFLKWHGCKKGDILYKDALSKAEQAHSLVKVLIALAEREDQKQENEVSEPKQNAKSDSSNAESLSKLVEMLEKGYLTQAEFQSEKAKLLGNS